MRKLISIQLLVIFCSISYSQHFDHLFDLKGMEDYNNNTHLYYRYGFLYSEAIDCWWKPLYHFDLSSGIDSIFYLDFGYPDDFNGCRGTSLNDLEFYNRDPQKFIWGGVDYYLDPVPKLVRYNGEVHLETFGSVNKIEFSNQTDSIVYVSAPPLFKSTDNGYNFDILDSTAWVSNAMISLSENNDSQIYGVDGYNLIRSEDEGKTYQIVDEDEHWYGWWNNYRLYYDADGQHIYGVCVGQTESALIFSDSNGDSSSWNTRLVYGGYLSFTHDKLYHGEVYYAIGCKVFRSLDFGSTFSLFTEFNNKVTGLYKKPGTDILYAATLSKIYKITPDTALIILAKPLPSYISYHYPLTIGNVWVYEQNVYEFGTGNTIQCFYTRKVMGETTQLNGETYYIVNEYDSYLNSTKILYERIDPVTFKLFRYEPDSVLTNQEYLLDDLFVLLGDTVKAYRYFPHLTESRITVYNKANQFRDFGLQFAVPRIQFNTYSNTNNEFNYTLTFAIGLDSFYLNKFEQYKATFDLKGFIIDGILHGDTTTVDVEVKTQKLPMKYAIFQNYPNPFNPATKIKYTIPERSFVSIKVYDVLGNEVATLVNEEKTAGEYEVEFIGSNLPSGIYFYQLQSGEFIQTNKMILLK